MKVYLLKFDYKDHHDDRMVIVAANGEEKVERLAKGGWWFHCILNPAEYEYLTTNVTESQTLTEGVYEE